MEYGPKYINIDPITEGGRQARVKVERSRNYFMSQLLSVELQEKRKHFGWRTLDETVAFPNTPDDPDSGWDYDNIPEMVEVLTEFLVERARKRRKLNSNVNQYLSN